MARPVSARGAAAATPPPPGARLAANHLKRLPPIVPVMTTMVRRPRPKPLAEFELLLVLAAPRLGPHEAYTVSIVEDIEGRTGRSVRRANVYTTNCYSS